MRNPTKLRRAALVAALATVTATAFAMHEEDGVQLLSSNDGVIVAEKSTTVYYVDPNEAIIEEPTPGVQEVAIVPVVERSYTVQPALTIEERRLTLDERIKGDVIDAVYAVPNISGKIGVESNDAVVTLTGYTMNSGQSWRAARAAGSVQGVRYVQNEIRAKMGKST